MTLVLYKAIAALIIFLAGIITVLYPLRNKGKAMSSSSLELGEALASGIFLGVAFFHMLPHSIEVFQRIYGTVEYPIAEAICAGGFIFLLFLERLSFQDKKEANTVPYILAIILIIHSLTEGAALGVGDNFAEAFLIFVAIIAHKGSASFALCITLMRYHLPFSRIIFMILLFSLMTPLGIGFGTLINYFTQSTWGELLEASFDAFAAGTFLYMSALHHIRFHQRAEKSQNMLEFACLAFGLVTMGVIAAWV